MLLVIANKNYSSWSLRPWLLMTKFGLEFEVRVESLAGEDVKERLRQYSPSCKVPVLIDGKLTVWDSLAICEYVSEQYLGGKGWPTAVATRAHARAICAEMHSGFMALRSEMPMNIRARRMITPSLAALADIRRIDEIWSECRREYGKDGDWLFGTFSIADCMYAPVALRFMTYGTRLSESSQRYMDSILNNTVVQSWMEAASKDTEIIPEDEAGDELK
jgi:glutathione S-transferase